MKASNENIDRVEDLITVADCMDDQTTIDTDQIYSDLNQQKDLLKTCLNMWWVSVAFFALEVLAFISCVSSMDA